jgi:hypothetical protein
MVFIQGIRTAMGQWRLTAIVYFLQFCLALTVGMQVYDVLEASIGQSLEIKKLLYAYDHTVVTDFLKVHGGSITPLIGQLRWLLLVWLVFSVFTNAGLLHGAAHPQAATPRSFWQAGGAYFWPFLGNGLVFWLLALLWTVLLFSPVVLQLQASLEYFPSEKYTVWMVFGVFVVWLLGIFGLFVWSVVARLLRFNGGTARQAARLVWRNKRAFSRLVVVFVGLHLGVIGLYWLLEGVIGMTSAGGIVIVFILQQLFVFCRIQLRQALYASIALRASVQQG